MTLKLAVALGLGFAVGLVGSSARANCAMPVGYKVTVAGNTVTVCPQDFGQRPCPDAQGMLRVDTTAGAPVTLDNCGTGNDASCYVDECVPKGTYQYGYVKPFDCCGSCCGTSYYEEVTVTTDPTGCTPNSATQAFTGTVPWQGKGQTICDYAGGGGAPAGGGSGGQAGSAQTGGQAGSTPTGGQSGSTASGGGDDGGCAVRGLRGPTGAILGFNSAVAALGLLLMARRRRTQQ